MQSSPGPGTPLEVVEIAGAPLVNLPLGAAARHVAAVASAGTTADIHLVNAYTIGLVDCDPAVRRIISGAAANFADGKPLTWAAKLLLRRSLHHVPGPELFEQVMAVGHEYGLRHFLLGSTPKTLHQLRQQLATRHPQAVIVGIHSPPFRRCTAEEVAIQDRRIRESGACIVWVGLGTPKQDIEAARLAHRIGITAVAVGAAFDFSAGTLRRAPRWMRALGLEWFFRLAMEPRRLYRRYTVGNARFARAILFRLNGHGPSGGKPRERRA